MQFNETYAIYYSEKARAFRARAADAPELKPALEIVAREYERLAKELIRKAPSRISKFA